MPADRPPFIPADLGRSMSAPEGGDIPPFQPGWQQGGAPAGPLPTEGELPIKSADGPGATTGGFRPSPATHPLPTPGSTEGNGLPPTGSRR